MAHLDEAAVTAMVAHMNDDHTDAVAAYVRHYCNMPEVVSATLLSIEPKAMRIAAQTGDSTQTVTVDFNHDLRDADDARDTLIAMARTALAS
jgi:putative heme iron utilization protein